MPEPRTLADLKRLYNETHSAWEDSGFYRERQGWTELLDRRVTYQWDDALLKYSLGAERQSPLLEDSRKQWLQILTLDFPKLDTIALDSSQAVKEDVEDVRIYLASLLQSWNEGGWLSASIAQGQVQFGVAVTRTDWRGHEEPDEDYYEGKGAKDPEARLVARGEYFKEKKDQAFRVTDVSAMEMCWSPLDQPVNVFQRSVIPYSTAKELERSQKLGGGKLRLADLDKIYWLGDPEAGPEDAVYGKQGEQKRIELLIWDYQKPGTEDWYTCEYVCVEGQDYESEGQLLGDYLNPLGQSRYTIIPSGGEVPLATDPHLRYRPEMYAEFVLTADKNFWESLLVIILRMEVNEAMFYLDGSKISQEQASALEMLGFTAEGTGALRRYTMPRAEPGSNEIALMPGEIKAWPFPPLEKLLAILERNDRDLLMVRPNRFLTGQAYANARDPAPDTATQHLDVRQAAALPADADLKKSDSGYARMLRGARNALIYWDKDAEGGTQKTYHVVTMGAEPLLTRPREAGEEVTVTADKLRRNMHIVVKTTNETQAERIQKNLAADDALAKGVITRSQHLKLRGHDDPEQQIEELEKFRLEELTKKEFEPVEIMMIKAYASALTGLNLGIQLPPPLAVQEQAMMSGGGQGGPGQMIQAGPAMTAAPIEQPTGGSSGMSQGGVV